MKTTEAAYRFGRLQNECSIPDSAAFSSSGKILFELSQEHEPRLMKPSERLF
jgi:hypothetical protein